MDSRLPKRIESLSKAFQSHKAYDLKKMGRDYIEDAAVDSDKDLAAISVIAYCLYKMTTKNHIMNNPRWKIVSQTITKKLNSAKIAAEKNNQNELHTQLQNTIGEIEFIDNELSNYARNVYEKGKIKQASTAYASGLSLSQAAALTDANKRELQEYIGATRIHDESLDKIEMQERLEKLRRIIE